MIFLGKGKQGIDLYLNSKAELLVKVKIKKRIPIISKTKPTGKLIVENKFRHLKTKLHIFQLVNMVQILFTINNVNIKMHEQSYGGAPGQSGKFYLKAEFPNSPHQGVLSPQLYRPLRFIFFYCRVFNTNDHQRGRGYFRSFSPFNITRSPNR